MSDEFLMRRGELPADLVAALTRWAHAQRCHACGETMDVRDGAVVTVLLPTRGVVLLHGPAVQMRVIAVHPRCGARIAEDADLPTVADEIRAELAR